MVQEITSLKQFNELINSGKVIFIDFWATWCGPCRFISPTFEKLEGEHKRDDVEFYKLDVDAVPEVAQEAGIRAMPTFHVYKNGQKAGELVGANQGGLQQLITTHKE